MTTIETTAGNEIFSYWRELAQAGALPLQRAFDPSRVRHRLPDLFILGLERNGDPIFRLAGTRICAIFDQELRGHSYGGLWHASQQTESEAIIRSVLTDGAPAVSDVIGISPNAYHSYELLLLPMRSGESAADRILGSLVRREPRQTGATERVSCLYSRGIGTAEIKQQDESQENQRFSTFMKRLLSIEIIDEQLSGKES